LTHSSFAGAYTRTIFNRERLNDEMRTAIAIEILFIILFLPEVLDTRRHNSSRKNLHL